MKAPGWPGRSPSDRGPGDAVRYLQADVTARACVRGSDDHFRGASRDAAASRRQQVDYVKEVTAIGGDGQAALRYSPRTAGGLPFRNTRRVPSPRRPRPRPRFARP